MLSIYCQLTIQIMLDLTLFSLFVFREVTGFLQVFLTVFQEVGRKIQPTGYKTMRTHRRDSFRAQEGLTDQYRPQNHQNDRSHRNLDILTVFVPVGTSL